MLETCRAPARRRQAQLLADGLDGPGRWTHPYDWAANAPFGDPAQ